MNGESYCRIAEAAMAETGDNLVETAALLAETLVLVLSFGAKEAKTDHDHAIKAFDEMTRGMATQFAAQLRVEKAAETK